MSKPLCTKKGRQKAEKWMLRQCERPTAGPLQVFVSIDRPFNTSDATSVSIQQRAAGLQTDDVVSLCQDVGGRESQRCDETRSETLNIQTESRDLLKMLRQSGLLEMSR